MICRINASQLTLQRQIRDPRGMDVKLMLDGLAQNAQPLAIALFIFCVIALLLRTRVAKRLWASIEETFSPTGSLGCWQRPASCCRQPSGWTHLGRHAQFHRRAAALRHDHVRHAGHDADCRVADRRKLRDRHEYRRASAARHVSSIRPCRRGSAPASACCCSSPA